MKKQVHKKDSYYLSLKVETSLTPREAAVALQILCDAGLGCCFDITDSDGGTRIIMFERSYSEDRGLIKERFLKESHFNEKSVEFSFTQQLIDELNDAMDFMDTDDIEDSDLPFSELYMSFLENVTSAGHHEFQWIDMDDSLTVKEITNLLKMEIL